MKDDVSYLVFGGFGFTLVWGLLLFFFLELFWDNQYVFCLICLFYSGLGLVYSAWLGLIYTLLSWGNRVPTLYWDESCTLLYWD